MSGPNPKARERFAATGTSEAPLPGTILASWSRSRLCGAGPDRREARFDGSTTDGDSRLRRAAQPVLERLSADLTDTPTALLLSDPGARVVRRWASEPAMARLMDRVRAAEGFVLSEDTVGTNGVGTPLEAGRPVVVVGTAHYNEIFDDASCAGAPVRHPVTGRLEGVVSLTCRADAATPLQLPLIAAAARDVEQRLFDAASATERQLLEAFTAARHRTTRPVLCVGEDVVLATPAAARLLEGVSQGLLWERARRAVSDGGERVCALALDGDEELLARCHAVGDGAAMVGVLVAIDPPPAARARRRGAAAPRGLAGRSAAWRAAAAAVTHCAVTRTPLLLWGEPGVGKAALVTAVERTAAVLDGRLEAADDPRAWLARAQTALATGGTVLVRHADALAPRTLDALASLPRAATAWVAATATGPTLAERLGARAVELPPLRTRPEDIAPIALALRRGRRVRPEALQLLERLPWPGNVRELDSALRSAAGALDVRLEDLPAELRARAARVPTSGLQRVEADAIARALAGCGGNKRDAARELGISRSTLYRKLRAYGLDLEHRAW